MLNRSLLPATARLLKPVGETTVVGVVVGETTVAIVGETNGEGDTRAAMPVAVVGVTTGDGVTAVNTASA